MSWEFRNPVKRRRGRRSDLPFSSVSLSLFLSLSPPRSLSLGLRAEVFDAGNDDDDGGERGAGGRIALCLL